MNEGLSLSDYLSIGALIISSISLFLSWRQFSRDRGRLQLKLNFIEQPRGGAFTLVVTNDGRRPVTISKVFLCSFSSHLTVYRQR